MISRENYKAVRIQIVTYKENLHTAKGHLRKMSHDRRHRTDSNKFICSVCLNNRKYNEDEEKKMTVHKSCEFCTENVRGRATCDKIKFNKESKFPKAKSKTISVQTQDTDFNKSINLLNEVLTVFQSNKQIVKQKSNTVILKDASISTDNIKEITKPQLQVSKVFQFSTDEVILNSNDKSTIIISHEDFLRSQYSIDLPKHKSSSVPQMKSEELRNSSKEKMRSKDAVEEVNRMFGNVKRRPGTSDVNRPLVRNGPRILPVVKNKTDIDRIWSPCKCKSEELSSGDSFVKPECYHNKDGNTEKCVYMMCCLKNCHKMPTGMMYCQCCRGENFRVPHNRADFDFND